MAGFKKVQPGERLNIGADEWNSLMDMGAAFSRTRIGGSEHAAFPALNTVAYCKNNTGVSLLPLAIVGLGETLNKPSTQQMDFISQMSFTGELPAITHIGQFGVVLNTIESGRVGRIAVGGIVPATVEMDDDGDEYCDVLPGSLSKLRSGAGTARLLYVQPRSERTSPTDAQCYVQLSAIEWQSWVKITGAAISTNSNRWRYSGIEQRPKLVSGRMDFEDRVGGQTWTNIYSPSETFNVAARTATPVPSTGVPQAAPAYPATFNVRPLANGLVVPIKLRRMKENDTITRVPWIVYTNADFGTCS